LYAYNGIYYDGESRNEVRILRDLFDSLYSTAAAMLATSSGYAGQAAATGALQARALVDQMKLKMKRTMVPPP